MEVININYLEMAKSNIENFLLTVMDLIESAKFDKTFRAKVVEIISERKCKVQYKNIVYIAKNNANLSVGDSIWVKAPCNNWNELYIQSGNQSDNAELITQITELNNEITELETEIANLKTQLTQTNSNLNGEKIALSKIEAKLPTDITYINAVLPRIKSTTNANSSILADVKWIINNKGIISGEYAFANCTYSDVPDINIKNGVIRFFKHDDSFVTVTLYPETTQNMFYRRFVLTGTTWSNKWWKTNLVEVSG